MEVITTLLCIYWHITPHSNTNVQWKGAQEDATKANRDSWKKLLETYRKREKKLYSSFTNRYSIPYQTFTNKIKDALTKQQTNAFNKKINALLPKDSEVYPDLECKSLKTAWNKLSDLDGVAHYRHFLTNHGASTKDEKKKQKIEKCQENVAKWAMTLQQEM